MGKYIGSSEIWSKTFLPLDNSEDIPKYRVRNMISLSSDPNLLQLFSASYGSRFCPLQATFFLAPMPVTSSLLHLTGDTSGVCEREKPGHLTFPVCPKQHPSQQLHFLCDPSFCLTGSSRSQCLPRDPVSLVTLPPPFDPATPGFHLASCC